MTDIKPQGDLHAADVRHFSLPPAAVSRWARRVLIAGFVLAITLPVLAEISIDFIRMGAWRGWYSIEDWSQNPSFTQLEHDLASTALFGRLCRQVWREKTTGFKLGGGNAAYIGKNGWLFLRTEIDAIKGPANAPLQSQHAEQMAAQIVATSDAFNRRGIHLIFASVPMKATIYPEYAFPNWGDVTRPATETARNQWIANLRTKGVDVVDLLPDLMAAKASDAQDGPLYIPMDTHWMPRGTLVTAPLLAARAQAYLKQSPKCQFTTRIRRVTLTEDLVNILGYRPKEKLIDFSVADVKTVLLDGQVIDFGNDASVALLGDSYTELYEGPGAGLGHQLALELGMPVQTFAIRGGAVNEARAQLWANPDALRHKKVVIWIPAERFLLDDEVWQPIK